MSETPSKPIDPPNAPFTHKSKARDGKYVPPRRRRRPARRARPLLRRPLARPAHARPRLDRAAHALPHREARRRRLAARRDAPDAGDDPARADARRVRRRCPSPPPPPRPRLRRRPRAKDAALPPLALAILAVKTLYALPARRSTASLRVLHGGAGRDAARRDHGRAADDQRAARLVHAPSPPPPPLPPPTRTPRRRGERAGPRPSPGGTIDCVTASLQVQFPRAGAHARGRRRGRGAGRARRGAAAVPARGAQRGDGPVRDRGGRVRAGADGAAIGSLNQIWGETSVSCSIESIHELQSGSIMTNPGLVARRTPRIQRRAAAKHATTMQRSCSPHMFRPFSWSTLLILLSTFMATRQLLAKRGYS